MDSALIYKNLSLENLEGETWRAVVGYEGLYEVSNFGRIKSFNKNGNNKNSIRIQRANQFGYLVLTISKDNKKKLVQAHRLVAKTFIPNPDNKPQVNHKKGIKTDNRVSELEWATRSENSLHSFHILNNRKALDNLDMLTELNTIFKEKEIKDVLVKRASGLSVIEIAKEYNAHRSTITNIIRNNKDKFDISIPHNLPRVVHQTAQERKNTYLKITQKKSNAVIVYDINNKFIARFPSKRELSREYNLDRKCINLCCKGLAKQHKGFIIKNDN